MDPCYVPADALEACSLQQDVMPRLCRSLLPCASSVFTLSLIGCDVQAGGPGRVLWGLVAPATPGPQNIRAAS